MFSSKINVEAWINNINYVEAWIDNVNPGTSRFLLFLKQTSLIFSIWKLLYFWGGIRNLRRDTFASLHWDNRVSSLLSHRLKLESHSETMSWRNQQRIAREKPPNSAAAPLVKHRKFAVSLCKLISRWNGKRKRRVKGPKFFEISHFLRFYWHKFWCIFSLRNNTLAHKKRFLNCFGKFLSYNFLK